MFIGSSPCSTGGGIKTTTFVIIAFTAMSVLRGKKDTVIKKHFIDKNLVYRSVTITVLAVLAICIISALVLTSEKSNTLSYLDVVFESVSAFSTGISLGVTQQLTSQISKIFLCLLMFLGRIGPFSLAIGLTLKKNRINQTILPEVEIMVG